MLTARRHWSWQTIVAAHRDAIVALLAASVEDNGLLGYPDEVTPAQADGFVRGLQDMVDSGAGHLLLCEDEDGVCGMAVMRTNGMPNCRHIADLSKGFLHRRVRGGAAILEKFAQICAKARACSVEVLTLDVREGSAAHRVWTRLGWRTYGVLPDYARYRGQSYSGHYMWTTVAELERALQRWRRHDHDI
jgi:hypothetical protein